MCYLVVKKFNRQGSVALKTKHGKGLVAISKSLTKLTKGKGIQIVTISRPDAYVEYAPYTIIEDQNEFMGYVKDSQMI